MIYSLTDKLTFAENPKIQIKDKLITVKAEAETALKVFDVLSKEDEATAILKCYEIIFSDKDRKAIKSMGLSMEDFITLMKTAVALCIGEDPDAEKSE